SRDWSSDVCSSDLSGCGGVTATLQHHAREERLVRLAVVLVDDVGDLVVHGERLDHIRAGADRVGPELVQLVLARPFEDVLRQDDTAAGTGGGRSEERRVGKE